MEAGDKNFEQNLAELENLVRRLDGGELPAEALEPCATGRGPRLHAGARLLEARVDPTQLLGLNLEETNGSRR